MADEAGVVDTTAGATDLLNRRLSISLHENFVVEFLGTVPVYLGRAKPGTVITFAPDGLPHSNVKAWAICKLTADGSGNVVAGQWAGGTIAYAFAWDDRASLTY